MLISREFYIENEDVNLDKGATETAPTQSACLRASLIVMPGTLAGFHSIRINQQWRIIFNWKEGNANNVKIVDYH